MAAEDGSVRRYLVLVVGMLMGPEAAEQLYWLSKRQPSSFRFIVPATKPSYGLSWTESRAIEDATERLEMILEFSEKLGMQVDGRVDIQAAPVEAVREEVAQAEVPFNELIVIDRPKGLVDRWMAGQALEHLHEKPGLPITHLEANPPLQQGKHWEREEYRKRFEEWRRGLQGE